MRRKGLLLVISLLALATLMAAMSFSSATVQAQANLRITNQSNGLVALLPGQGTTSASSDDLLMDFTEGTSDKGIQPGSVYVWNNLFTIQNNTTYPISVKISDFGGIRNYVAINFTANNELPFNGDAVTVEPNSTLNVSAKIDATNTTNLMDGQEFHIKVSATKVN
jgi:hypothetical protein